MSWRFDHCGFSASARAGIVFGPPAAIVAIGTTLLGTGLSVAGQSQRAAANAAQANYMAQVARNNQQLAEINAQQAEAQGESDAERQELSTAQIEGKQRASLAAQGGDVNSGSNLDLLADTARAGATDVAAIHNNAAWKAYESREQGLRYQGAANADEAVAGNAMASLPFGIGSSLLGGASSIANKWTSAFPDTGGGVSVNYGSGNAASGFGSYAPSNAFGWS